MRTTEPKLSWTRARCGLEGMTRMVRMVHEITNGNADAGLLLELALCFCQFLLQPFLCGS